jgi:hypothetical protein
MLRGWSFLLQFSIRGLFAGLALAAEALSFSHFAYAIGGQFGMEFAIDAPWRLEPIQASNGQLTYPPIPITIAFHDTIFEDGRGKIASVFLEPIDVGRLVGVTVHEMGTNVPQVTEVPVSALQEIEVKHLLSTKVAEPTHQVCRPALGQQCSALLQIGDTHEWHAVFWYRPKTALFPGKNLQLKVTVKTVGKHSFKSRRTGGIAVSIDMPKEWTNYLVVHMGEAPLPRFGADWLYGDVHHHSQMTDNEGESAYTYRNDVRALGALGLDFVFATDHASNGEQVDGKVNGQIEARDLNGPRFAVAKSILYGPDGANALIVDEGVNVGFPRIRSANIVPQIYMGEELDAVPEISEQEFGANHFLFGDGLRYDWLFKQDGFIECNTGSNFDECKSKYATPASRDTYFLWDDQGVPVSQEINGYASGLGRLINYGNWMPDSVKPYKSRQHLIYFPTDTSLSGAGWIGSDTTRFGGASKSLPDLVRQIEATGFAFLAHPTESLEPGSIAGPDVVPYTDTALTNAWRSPAILGLQLWNENDRYRSQPGQIDKTVMAVKMNMTADGDPINVTYTYRWPFPGYVPEGSAWKWQQAGFLHRQDLVGSTALHLHHGSAAWDRFLRKGVDLQQTASLEWLAKGEPRKWFAAGGSDSHGDWNYRRYGRPSISSRWSDVPVGDTAIGNPRNLVWMRATQRLEPRVATEIGLEPDAGPRRYANRTVIDGFREGRFSVTDGPAIRIAVDRNRNGRIDDSDFPMGSTFTFFPGEHIPLLVEWQSTPEFGPIDRIDVYVGNSRETYAPPGHGARHLQEDEVGGYTKDPSGVLSVSLADPVGRFNRENLPPGLAYQGTAQFFLGPAQFNLALADGALSYVRAVARTVTDAQAQTIGVCPEVGTAGSKCGDRFALSNPIWARYSVACPAVSEDRPPRIGGAVIRSESKPYIDADDDGQPDVCTSNIPDPCTDPRRPDVVVDVGPPVAEGERGAIGDHRGRDFGRHIAEAAERFGIRPAKPIPNKSCQKLAAAP